MNLKTILRTAIVCASLSSVLTAQHVSAQEANSPSPQVIVKWRTPVSVAARSATAMQALQEAEGRSGLAAQALRNTATGAEVLRLAPAPSREQLTEFMATIRRSPDVEYVEEDKILHAAFVPNDPRYNEQWHYFEAAAGINVPAAWDVSTGSGITVAVIDTGYRPHADLVANILPGYDFISDPDMANDGDGNDADALDPGDACGSEPSSWHGTHVAGTIAAVTNNGSGVAGVAFNSRILPVRVLGKCGGFVSDISDGITWAAGLTVHGAPFNFNPARVLNMSLGGVGSCPSTMQNAVNLARSSGAVVVVAAGNDNSNASNFTPANCAGVITVAAVNRNGGKAWYSNFGSVVDVAAPGGDTSISSANGVWSTLNTGLTTPGSDTFASYQGTSMATPHVAGIAALILSRSPAFAPSDVENVLRNTARGFPTACSGCGAGIVDASAAVGITGTPPAPATISGSPDKTTTGIYSVFWSSSPGATHYIFERNKNFTGWGGTEKILGTSKGYTVKQALGEYQHRVKACTGNLCSDWRTGAFVLVCSSSTGCL